MLEAAKKYGSPQESPIDEINISLGIFRNHLSMLDDLMIGFNATRYYTGNSLERLYCLNDAAEYVQLNKEMQTRFMGLSKRLKGAYQIVFPTGELTEIEISKAQFYLAIRSIIYKQTIGDAPDAPGDVAGMSLVDIVADGDHDPLAEAQRAPYHRFMSDCKRIERPREQRGTFCISHSS